MDHVLFDLDGTIISGYMDSPSKDFHSWHVLRGRVDMLAQLRRDGVTMSLITNQAGVAFGFNTEGDVTTKLILVAQALGFSHLDIYDGSAAPRRHGYTSSGGGLLTAHVAYEHPNAKNDRYREHPDTLATNRRKPSPNMIYEALRGLNRGRALMVGDRPEDQSAAKNAGVRFVWASQFFGE